jgi:hypothetical protein
MPTALAGGPVAAALASTSRASYNAIVRASQAGGRGAGGGGVGGLTATATLQRTAAGGSGLGASGGGGAAAPSLSSLLASQPQREVYQESLATGGFLRVGAGWGGRGGGGLGGGGGGGGELAEGAGIGGGGGSGGTAAAFMRARQLGRRSGALGGAGSEGEGQWSLEDSMLLPGETLFSPAQKALGRVTRLCEALHTGLLLMLVLQLAQLAGAPSATWMATLAPLAPNLRLAQYVLACLALVGAAFQSASARVWSKGPGGGGEGGGGGCGGRRGTGGAGGGAAGAAGAAAAAGSPPPATLLHRARYLTFAALAHAGVVVTIMAALPYDNKLRVLANRAAAAATPATPGGYNWAALGADADGAIASWSALAYLRFVAAGSALALSTLASLSPAEAALLYFQAK